MKLSRADTRADDDVIADLQASNSQLRESERRWREIFHAVPTAIYACDGAGRVIAFNQAAVELWGRVPCVGKDYWCGSHRLYRDDGTALDPALCPMAKAVRGEPFDDSSEVIIVERPDSTRRYVRPHPRPLCEADGSVAGAVNLVVDVTAEVLANQERLATETRFRRMADAAPTLIWMSDTHGQRVWFNRPWLDFTGRTAEQELGDAWMDGVHPDDRATYLDAFRAHFQSRTEFRHEYRLRRADAEYRWVLDQGAPNFAANGAFDGFIGSCVDITDQVAARRLLEEQHSLLEQAVRHRTRELAAASERLRLTDRLATIGTLSAGLGHDMGNLLLPVRMRLDAMEASDLPDEVRDDVAAIRKALDYLQRLTGSLRMLSVDPDREDAQVPTDVAAWWQEAEGMLLNGIPRTTALSADIEPGLPPIQLGKPALTQAIFNLVQNAGDALRTAVEGRVQFRVSRAPCGTCARLTVSDNGPGMSPEARARCLEPFFTTKTRALGTGLGLPLVKSIVARAGGSLEVESTEGGGASVTLIIPLAEPRPTIDPGLQGVAAVQCADPRVASYIDAMLAARRYAVRRAEPDDTTRVWITDRDGPEGLAAALAFLRDRPDRLVISLTDDADSDSGHPRFTRIGQGLRMSALRTALDRAMALAQLT
ncbi:MAG: PAS domain-containing sensor histidine kinase [Planctomycetota bacterium]|nr:PAS domain-containing sensor histidine kinase [Planctomycetota bacterium]